LYCIVFFYLYTNQNTQCEVLQAIQRAHNDRGLFLPLDASAERGYEIACRPSVRLSVCLTVCDDQVPCSDRFEFFENNFTSK